MDDRILDKMYDAEQCNATLVFKDGRTLHGYVDVYESRYDNDGEASICFAGENGENTIVYESELEDVVVDNDAE